MSNKTDRLFRCEKCKVEYLETNKHITKCICPTDHIIMLEIKKEVTKNG